MKRYTVDLKKFKSTGEICSVHAERVPDPIKGLQSLQGQEDWADVRCIHYHAAVYADNREEAERITTAAVLAGQVE